ncbi:MAG: alpha/beta hydrolase [Chloroflexi bacterium]|nr:alpha/beta hydrolase [Chloroflexota bacterium]
MNPAYEPPAEGWADAGALRMRYLDWGGFDRLTTSVLPVVALHGLASSAHWYDTIAPLLRGRYRIVAPDQRGHGKTTQARSGYDWQSLACDVIGLMDSLGISRAAVLGHSWGGNVAINVAARFPERVASLALIDGGTFDPKVRGLTSWEAFHQRLAPRDVSGTRQQFLDRMRAQLWMCWSEEIERIVQTMVYQDESGQTHDILRPDNHAQVMRAMWDEPASNTWPHIRCRTLIVAAGPMPERANTEFALMRKRTLDAAHQAIKNSRVCWIPETIHDIGWHKPKELATAIDEFLAGD